MTLNCPGCGSTNRIPSLPTARVRCGKCKREFQPLELAKATPEPPAAFHAAKPDPDLFDCIFDDAAELSDEELLRRIEGGQA